jgi:hypothetical protein
MPLMSALPSPQTLETSASPREAPVQSAQLAQEIVAATQEAIRKTRELVAHLDKSLAKR